MPGQRYKVGIVGESNYQRAVKACRVGQAVTVALEPDNPKDADAIVVRNRDGATIGYIPKANFVQRLVHDEGKGIAASIAAINGGGRKPLGVVIDVELTSAPLAVVNYRAPTSSVSGGFGGLAKLAALALVVLVAKCAFG